MTIPAWIDVLGRVVEGSSGFWVKLGNLETKLHSEELEAVSIDRPIWIAGLARSGSTILLEILAERPGVATHRYRDFPPVYTPLLWNRAFARVYSSDGEPEERAHKDRIRVTPDSPEAMEEPLWMRFFEGSHDTSLNQVLDAKTSNPDFEAFYRDHIKKLLYLRSGQRYLAKGNYNITRLAYLAKLYPDARFIVPVREPTMHIASLAKQHRLFCDLERDDERILNHMRREGHFEFGLDRRPINTGDTAIARSIDQLWSDGQDVRGLARQWASVYGFLVDQLQRDPTVRERTLVVRYEELCGESERLLGRVFEHVGLAPPDDQLASLAARLSPPAYYAPSFTEAEQAAIREETDEVAAKLGYSIRAKAA